MNETVVDIGHRFSCAVGGLWMNRVAGNVLLLVKFYDQR